MSPEGRFGPFGGRYVGETLVPALEELQEEWRRCQGDPSYWQELRGLLEDFAGRPTPLMEIGGGLWIKREDLLHTGAHKINNALGQVLLARRVGKTDVIAETGAGQHGVATAAACAYLGMSCRVWMGEEDIVRQAPNVQRMKLFGAKVLPASSGHGTLQDAVSAAIRDWSEHIRDSHYIIGSVVGPAPYPEIVRDLQRTIGDEARKQFLEEKGALPDRVVACLGGGSNALGGFYAFLPDPVQLVAVEAGGRGIDSQEHGASLLRGSEGVLHGAKSMILQSPEGQILPAHSLSAGLDYPGVGPEHAWLFQKGRVEASSATDEEALHALRRFSCETGILPALETAHALAWYYRESPPGETLLILSGRGDKDLPLLQEQENFT